MSARAHRRICTIIPLLLGLVACGEPPPDLILTGGRVYTFAWPDPNAEGRPAASAPYDASEGGWQPDGEAVAIRDGLILAVGSAAEIAALQGPETQVLELEGATVLPGLVDSHTHITELGAKLAQVDLVGVTTEEEAVRLAEERARQTPPGEWVLGAGWDEGAWADRYPSMELLSERIPDHPVYLRSLHGFAGWGNRMAFERAGIDASTPTPTGGEILKDSSGVPTGVLLNRAVPLLDDHIPAPSPEALALQIREGLSEMARSGYVAVHYAGVSAASVKALENLRANGGLPIRVYAMLSGRDTVLLKEWESRGPMTNRDAMLQVRAVKAYYDGSLGVRGARLLADYTDQPGHRGVSGDGYGFDQRWIARMMRAGFQVGIHAIGDAGNRETLDFIQSVASRDPDVLENRNRIEHAQVVAPEDFERFRELQITASMEPPHAVEDMPWAEERLGPGRTLGAYAWRTMRQHGVPLIFNSDLPGSDWNVFYGLHAAMTRRDRRRRPAGGWYPAQVVTAEEAVRAYSTWAARSAFLEDHTGRLTPGRWADITVMDVDPMARGAADQLLNGRILMTVVGGRILARN